MLVWGNFPPGRVNIYAFGIVDFFKAFFFLLGLVWSVVPLLGIVGIGFLSFRNDIARRKLPKFVPVRSIAFFVFLICLYCVVWKIAAVRTEDMLNKEFMTYFLPN